MAEAKVTNVVPTLQDFLTVDPKSPQYRNVKAVLLDPSCSGSGMVTRFDHAVSCYCVSLCTLRFH